MSATRIVRHSIHAVTRYRLRNAFIVLASLVGVAALTLVVSIGRVAERKVMLTMNQLFGTSSIIVVARGTQLMGGPRGDAARLTLDDIDAIARELPEVDAWDPQQALRAASVRRGDASATVRVLGQSERSERVWSRGVTRGTYFDEAAVRSSARVALIGETAAARLFAGEDPLDAEISIGSVPFRVIGVLERFGTDIHGMDRDNEIVVPITTMMRRVMNVDTIALAKLLVRDPSRSEATAAEIRRILRARHATAAGAPDDFSMLTPAEVRRMLGMVQKILMVYLPLAAAVALVVGGIVAAMLMLASVNARVSEIGLRRAVGARPEDIRLQVLVETVVTMLAGGMGGVAIGYVGAQVAANRMNMGPAFSWPATLLGLAVALAAGLIAGLLPARRAARMDPALALRARP